MKINSNLKLAVNTLNTKWSAQCGNVRVITWDEYVKSEHAPFSTTETYADFLESRGITFHPSPECIVVDYDFNDDELYGTPEQDEFTNDLDLLWNGMIAQGKTLYEHDGSGGGLYYGLNIYPAK